MSTTDIGSRIKQVRLSRNLTQTEFSKRLSISRGYLPSLESGKKEANDRILRLIASTFNVSEEWLRSGDGSMYASQPHASNTLIGAYERELARNFLQIQRAMAPSCERPGQIMALFNPGVSNDIFNYLASRLVSDQTDAHEADRIDALFRVAFPDYKQVVQHLRCVARDRVALFDQSHISALVDTPVSGYAAAGKPLNDHSDKSVAIPRKYLDDRFLVVEVRGNSMAPQINDGDFVVVQRDTLPLPGKPALIIVDGAEWEYTIKLLSYNSCDDTAILHSYNPDYDDLVYPRSQIIKAERIVHVVHK